MTNPVDSLRPTLIPNSLLTPELAKLASGQRNIVQICQDITVKISLRIFLTQLSMIFICKLL